MRAHLRRVAVIDDGDIHSRSPRASYALGNTLTEIAGDKRVLSGNRLVGINARCRFFKYTDEENAVYRPHLDGSWPGSGLNSRGEYVHDAYGDRRSRLTFLVYLNEGFEGGCTTFYMPDGQDGGLHARGVTPCAGAVLCFPQGNTASLLHEGSAVSRGTKYVIRSDVLYTLHAP